MLLEIFIKHFKKACILLNSQSTKKFLFKEKQAKTNSHYFQINQENRFKNNSQMIFNNISYVLKEGCSPAEAIDDLGNHPNTTMTVTCQLMQTLAIYLAILDTFREIKGEEAGKQLFDQIFQHGKLLLRDFDLYAGCTFKYGNAPGGSNEKLNIHPLSFFVKFTDNCLKKQKNDPHKINEGDLVYFDNHQDYSKLFPGNLRRIAATCVSLKDNNPYYVAFGFKDILKNEDIIDHLFSEFTKARFFQFDKKDIPGLNPSNMVRCVDIEKLQFILDHPDIAEKELENYLQEEINELEIMEVIINEFDKKNPKFLLETITAINNEAVKQTNKKNFQDAVEIYFSGLLIASTFFVSHHKKGVELDIKYQMATIHKNLAINYEKMGKIFLSLKHLEQSKELLIWHFQQLKTEDPLTTKVTTKIKTLRENLIQEFSEDKINKQLSSLNFTH